MRHSRRRGFTLIELMVVVAVVLILAALAYPSYTRYIERARRADAHTLLTKVATEQERFFSQFNRYALDLSTAPPAGLGMTRLLSEHGYYEVSVAAGPTGDNMTYALTATPQAQQANDACRNLMLNSAGTKTFSGSEVNGYCW